MRSLPAALHAIALAPAPLADADMAGLPARAIALHSETSGQGHALSAVRRCTLTRQNRCPTVSFDVGDDVDERVGLTVGVQQVDRTVVADGDDRQARHDVVGGEVEVRGERLR